MGKFILTEEEKTKIRGMYGLLNESKDGCDDLCQFMYRGSCEPIGVAMNSQNATNEWYKQKKIQYPEFFNPNRDVRLKEKYETTKNMSDNDKATFWVTIASLECDSPESFENYLNSEDPCKKPKMLA
jgi:hypothetical protein